MKKLKLFLSVAIMAMLFSTVYGQDNNIYDEGVIINGVKWATRNVSEIPNTFVSNPENYGGLFQWNRTVSDDFLLLNAYNKGRYQRPDSWLPANNPCPSGWRVPTRDELESLLDAENEWTTLNDINGRKFGTAPNQIFLPAAGSYARFIDRGDGKRGFYWSSSSKDARSAFSVTFLEKGSNWIMDIVKENGLSVRCVAE